MGETKIKKKAKTLKQTNSSSKSNKVVKKTKEASKDTSAANQTFETPEDTNTTRQLKQESEDASAIQRTNEQAENASQHSKVKGTEIFVGGLPTTVTEEKIEELFGSCGEIVEIRIMKDQSGDKKGYCFVRFSTKDAALKAQKDKNGATLEGKKVRVMASTDKDRLFLGNLPKDWSPSEAESMVRQSFKDVISVELALNPSIGDSTEAKKKQNRGFAFVQFSSHGAAARAHRLANKPEFMLGGKCHPMVDWAETETDVDPEELAKVKTAFVASLPNNVTDEFLQKIFEPYGKIERIAFSRKRNLAVAFVHFSTRQELENAIRSVDGKTVEGPEEGQQIQMQVTVAKPADKSKKRKNEDTESKKSVDIFSLESLPTKVSRLDAKGFFSAKVPSGSDPYEEALFSLPRPVTDCLLQIFRNGVATRYDIDLYRLTKLKELPEAGALTVLEQFAATNFLDGRNKGAFLLNAIEKHRQGSIGSARNPLAQHGSSELLSQDPLLMGITGAKNSPTIDNFASSRYPSRSSLIGSDRYSSYSGLSSLSQVPLMRPSDPLNTRTGDIHEMFHRGSMTTGLNLSGGLSESTLAKRPTMRYDPFTGMPYKFDPFTGEPL